MSNIIFSDDPYTWKTHTLYQFVYEDDNISPIWKEWFNQDKIKKELLTISDYLSARSKVTNILPELPNVFRAFRNRPKVVIIGQDPYTNKESAMGLSFSIPHGNKTLNPSLRNIIQELKREGWKVNEKSGDLTSWDYQGVMLLNTALTVEEGQKESHLELWVNFSTLLLQEIAKRFNPVFALWGAKALSFRDDIERGRQEGENDDKVKVVACSHPSPLSANKMCGAYPSFMGSDCFIKINKHLMDKSWHPINWSI